MRKGQRDDHDTCETDKRHKSLHTKESILSNNKCHLSQESW